MSPTRFAPRLGDRGALAVLAALAALVWLAPPLEAQPRPNREFAALDDHDPARFAYAVRYGSDLVKRDATAEFTLLLGGRGVLLVVPGSNVAQRDFPTWRQGTGNRLQVIACSETMTRLRQSVQMNVPVLPGVVVRSCDGQVQRMLSEGWRRMLGM